MTSEEIKSLGLRVGDVWRITKDYTIEHVDGDGLAVICVNHGGFPAKDIVAIERAMPPLPDGWEWNDAVRFGFAVEMNRDALTATIDANTGGIECWTTSQGPGQSGEHPSGRGRPCPALIAKALIEVWEQGQ